MKEIWKDVNGFKGYYKVSNMGNIKSLNRTIVDKNGNNMSFKERIIKQSNRGRGYMNVYLSKKCKKYVLRVHRIVAEAFIEKNKHKPEVNHKDGNKQNNKAENLEWVTHRENVIHSVKNGLHPVGERSSFSKLKKEEVIVIKKMLKEGNLTQKEISEIFDIDDSQISRIKNRKIWKSVEIK